ncbi:methyltransferase domain-containing protein [Candidatus Woesearchaeota archaeon]|nr:methyltransferase domain-containing protein [Candidatus Woesearchaeota archaeon]
MVAKTLLKRNPTKYGILFDIFRRSSDESEVLFNRLKEHIGNKQDKLGSLLDIGAGDGTITQLLMPYFDKVVAIDRRNSHVYALSAVGIEAHRSIWENFSHNEMFDVILASHVLYYFKENHCLEECKRIQYLLKPEGSAFIVFNSHHGEYADMMNHFYPILHGGRHPFSSTINLEDRLLGTGVDCLKEQLTFRTRFQNETHFLTLCEFFLGCETEDLESIRAGLLDYYHGVIKPTGQGRERYFDVKLDFIEIKKR